MYLPCKLIGMNRRYETREMINPLEKSCIEQRFQFPKIPKPSKKSIKLQLEFVRQLKIKEIFSLYNFENEIRCRY